jgi:5'-deoxynucleotidase YfbR-like HD superfamily hydrolase
MNLRGSENGNRYSPTGKEVLTGVTRRLIDVTNPQPEDIDIRDIAQSLARQERFTGHCPLRPSVAAHSLAVEYIARQLLDAGGQACVNDQTDALRAALMHDAPEFLVSDLNGAVKQDIRPKLVGVAARASAAVRGRSRFDLLEDRAEAAIAARFGYDSEAHDALIHEADVLACAYEMAYDNWAPEAEPPAWMLADVELLLIYSQNEIVTANRFLERAAELGIA